MHPLRPMAASSRCSWNGERFAEALPDGSVRGPGGCPVKCPVGSVRGPVGSVRGPVRRRACGVRALPALHVSFVLFPHHRDALCILEKQIPPKTVRELPPDYRRDGVAVVMLMRGVVTGIHRSCFPGHAVPRSQSTRGQCSADDPPSPQFFFEILAPIFIFRFGVHPYWRLGAPHVGYFLRTKLPQQRNP